MNAWLVLLAWLGVWTDGSKPVHDIPANHWIFDGLANLKREGLMVGSPDFDHRRNGVEYPYSVAIKVLFAMHTYRTLGQTTLQEHDSIVSSRRNSVSGDRLAANLEDQRALLDLQRFFPFFRRIEVEFLPQIFVLRQLDESYAPCVVEIERLAQRIQAVGPPVPGERLRPFIDVPVKHWAAKEIGHLRALGLLEGYPDGRFRGRLGTAE